MTLLDHVRALVEAERGLTEAIEQTLPLLSSNSNYLEASYKYNNFNSSSVIPPTSSSKRGAEPPLLPAPRCSAEVPTILAVARSYSLRTSAPPAWNTNLPVVGFATPNPLPHQLRGGALGAMQLSLAREEKKRKRNELLIESQKKEREERMKFLEEGEKAKKSGMGNAEQMEDVENEKEDMDNVVVDTDTGNSLPCTNDGMIIGGKNIDPKRQEMIERQRVKIVQQQQLTSRGQPPEELLKKKLEVSMNLSESSSSSSSDEEGSDNEERL